jgi:hypothetical protein
MKIIKILLGALLIAPLFQISYPYTSDWHIFFNAANGTLTPEMGGFHNPVWTLWLLKPFVVLGSLWAYCIIMGLTISSTLEISKSVSGKYWAGILAIVSVPFLRLMIHGQIEVFSLLGIFSTSIVAAPALLLIKPQTAIFSLAGRLHMSNRVALVISSFILGIIALVTMNFGHVNIINQNISIFPYGMILGIPLLFKSVKRGDILSGAVATPLCAPYVITHSIFVPLFCAYLRWPKLAIPLWIFVWYILMYYSGG